MSKETFSEKISFLMYDKIKNLEYLDTDCFFYKDDFFEISLCLAYMTLSKEKLIKKDMKETDRLGRLTKMIDVAEIDRLFDPKIFDEVPVINYSREQDNLWILDNIRDSILHGAFEIDEENRYFIIKNQMANRELDAIVPFGWFVNYSKSDILRLKKLDNYSVRGFYYNKYKENSKNLETRKEVLNNILYNIRISGIKFNVNEIEQRIKSLFVEYKDLEYDDNCIKDKYSKIITKYSKSYNGRYLISFLAISDKIKEQLESEFPGIVISIKIDNKKHKLLNKVEKSLPEYFRNYNLLMDELDNIISSKSNSLLNCLARIISNIEVFTDMNYSKSNLYERMYKFNVILDSNSAKYKNYDEIIMIFNQKMKKLRSICLNVYGLSTLVINQENLYNKYFLNQNPRDFNIMAGSKQKYLDYAAERKKIIMELLALDILLFEKKEQLSKCKSEETKYFLNNKINGFMQKKINFENDLCKLENVMQFEPMINKNMINYQKMEKLYRDLEDLQDYFDTVNNIKDKEETRKKIGLLIDKIKEEESVYTYGYCNNMEEVLTIIRNSFSHIGRISVINNKNDMPRIILNDYDNDGNKTGEARVGYFDLINMLRIPYFDNHHNKTL